MMVEIIINEFVAIKKNSKNLFLLWNNTCGILNSASQ